MYDTTNTLIVTFLRGCSGHSKEQPDKGQQMARTFEDRLIICVKYVAKCLKFISDIEETSHTVFSGVLTHFSHVLLLHQYSTRYCDFKERWPNYF